MLVAVVKAGFAFDGNGECITAPRERMLPVIRV